MGERARLVTADREAGLRNGCFTLESMVPSNFGVLESSIYQLGFFTSNLGILSIFLQDIHMSPCHSPLGLKVSLR